MRERKFKRELKRVRHMTLAQLQNEAKRNKRLLRSALAGRMRHAYTQRKALALACGREIARKMRQV